MSNTIQAIRGMNDILPDATPRWRLLERVAAEVLQGCGYREIRLPVVERTELFERSIGEVTDIVEKEMYTFEDRNGDRLSLRPEGTAGCVRAGVENGLLFNQQQRLWYLGPMFRHERPQKGRYRQFHQIGAEAFGMDGPEVEAELILSGWRIWQALGIGDGIRLELNTLGMPDDRRRYRQDLVRFLQRYEGELDADARRRLETNPLRILDSKNPEVQALLGKAPVLNDYLSAESREHFARLRSMLDDCGVSYTVNPRLVRGLDYYTRTVFEWITDRLGAQDAVCSGGRYDGLVEQLGGKPTPAVGFALGIERVIALCEQAGVVGDNDAPDVYFAVVSEAALILAMRLAEQLRDRGIKVLLSATGALKAQLRRADRSGARIACLMGDDEAAAGRVELKPLRSGSPQVAAPLSEAAERVGELLCQERSVHADR